MKKKFKDSLVGRITTGILKGAVRELPIVGGMMDHAASPVDGGGVGKYSKTVLVGQISAGLIILSFVLHGAGYLNQTAIDLIVEIIQNINLSE
jgi:hypothetical protein